MAYAALGLFLLVVAGLAYIVTRKPKDETPEFHGTKEPKDPTR